MKADEVGHAQAADPDVGRGGAGPVAAGLCGVPAWAAAGPPPACPAVAGGAADPVERAAGDARGAP